MLSKLRQKKTAKRIWWILAIIIIPPFVLLWGPGSNILRPKQKKAYSGYVGKIYGRKIPFSEYRDAYGAERIQAVIQLGDKFSELQKYLGLEARAWERLILLAEAKRRKTSVNDKEVIMLIQSEPSFQKKGRFDNQIYTQILEYSLHIKPRAYEEYLRQNRILLKLYNETTRNLNVIDEEIKEEYRKLNEQISLNYISSLFADFAKDIAPADEEIKDYFAKNSLQFKQAALFNLEYVSWIPQDETDEKTTEEKVKNFITRLNKGEDFNKLVKEFNFEIKETGFFAQTDPIPGIGWAQEVQNMLPKANPGDFLPAVHMDKNYYLLRLKEKKEPRIPDFTEVKAQAREAFSKDKSKGIAKEKIEDCQKKLKELQQINQTRPVDFDKAAKECNLRAGSTDIFKYGSYIDGIGASDDFFMQGRDLKENEISRIIEALTGFYIVRLKSKTPIDEEKFAKEKEELNKKLLLQKRQEHFAKFLEDLKRRVEIY